MSILRSVHSYMCFHLPTGKTLQDGTQEIGDLGMKEGSRLILMGRKVNKIHTIIHVLDLY